MVIIAEASEGAVQVDVVMARVMMTKECTPGTEGDWGGNSCGQGQRKLRANLIFM